MRLASSRRPCAPHSGHARADATVAVVTPYKSQKAEIWRHPAGASDSVVDDPRVRCNTVDSYQGQEADIVVFSCVRTRSLGFLRDERRRTWR